MPRRENVRRRPTSFDAGPTVLVYCGGLRTEPEYFHGLRRAARRGRVTIKIRAAGLAPDALVRATADYRDRRPGIFDDVWSAVDVDEFDVGAAVVEARRLDVHLAVSNPCFELWLLLHHADCGSHCAGCADAIKRLKKYVPAYDKRELDFAHFVSGVSDAVKRAKQLEGTGEDWRRNPSTGVWRLVEQIVEKR